MRSSLCELLLEGTADLIIGLPEEAPRIVVSQPYYRSADRFVYPASVGELKSVDDRSLTEKTIGVHLVGRSGTPPAHALAAVVGRQHAKLRGLWGREGPEPGW